MSTVRTVNTWIRLPSPAGASDRARADQSGDAALFQVLASNATLAARENGLRTLWERGPVEIWADCTSSDDERTLRWSATLTDGVLAQYAGTHRVRLYGEQAAAPQLVLTARGAAPSGFTLGIVLLALPTFGSPDDNAAVASVARTMSTTAEDITLALSLTPASLGVTAIAPTVSGSPPTVPESGRMTSVDVFVGAYCTSDSSGSKASIGSMTLYLRGPA